MISILDNNESLHWPLTVVIISSSFFSVSIGFSFSAMVRISYQEFPRITKAAHIYGFTASAAIEILVGAAI